MFLKIHPPGVLHASNRAYLGKDCLPVDVNFLYKVTVKVLYMQLYG